MLPTCWNSRSSKNLSRVYYKYGFYYKPRVDKEVLRQYSEGIIATSACLAGAVQRNLLNGDYASAKEEALEMLEIFGEGPVTVTISIPAA